jgi:hypothetical protein
MSRALLPTSREEPWNDVRETSPDLYGRAAEGPGAADQTGQDTLAATAETAEGGARQNIGAMSYVDWIFALHLLTAATLVGGFVMSWIVVVALRTANAPDATLSLNRVARVGTVVIVIGLIGTIALGIWTATLRPELRPWHGWAIAAIVLWAIAAAAVLRSFVEYAKPLAKARELIASGLTGPSDELTALNRAPTGLMLRGLASVAVVLIVVDMIYKPGA